MYELGSDEEPDALLTVLCTAAGVTAFLYHDGRLSYAAHPDGAAFDGAFDAVRNSLSEDVSSIRAPMPLRKALTLRRRGKDLSGPLLVSDCQARGAHRGLTVTWPADHDRDSAWLYSNGRLLRLQAVRSDTRLCFAAVEDSGLLRDVTARLWAAIVLGDRPASKRGS
jgi:hypothetical protein